MHKLARSNSAPQNECSLKMFGRMVDDLDFNAAVEALEQQEIKEIVEEKKSAKKRPRKTVPNWPLLPELASGGKGVCDVWDGEEFTWPEFIPVRITVPGSFRVGFLEECITWRDDIHNLVRIDPKFWRYSIGDFPLHREDAEPLTLTRMGGKRTIEGKWKIDRGWPNGFHYCNSHKLEFSFDWDAEWPGVAKARQQRWGIHPHVAVPAFMQYLESLAGRRCFMTGTQLRLMGYPMISENVMAHSRALTTLSGRWYCNTKKIAEPMVIVQDGSLVHPQPATLLPHALAAAKPVSGTPGLQSNKCTLVIHDSEQPLLPSMENVLRINTLEDLVAQNRKVLKHGSLTLFVHQNVFDAIPKCDGTDFAMYNERKKAGVPTLFADIEWGRVFILWCRNNSHPAQLPRLKCTFHWTLCTPDMSTRVPTSQNGCQALLEMGDSVKCNRHRMLQFVE
jgi:hypothetical protein